MGFAREFRLILWKNYILQKRKVCVTVFEILMPIVFAALLVIIRLLIKTDNVPDTREYTSFPVDGSFSGLHGDRPIEFLYAPDGNDVKTIMDSIAEKVNLKGIPFKDEAAMVSHYRQLGNQSDRVFGGLILTGESPALMTLTIRPRSTSDDKWDTRFMYPFFQSKEPRTKDNFGGKPNYKNRGFLAMQYAVVSSIIEHMNASINISADSHISLHQMPYPPYHSDPFILVVQQQFPLFLLLSFILNALQNTKNIVYEKERKLKESMKMMGLSNFAHWSAWFVKCFTYLFIAMAVFTALCSIPVGPLSVSVLGNSDPSVFFVFLICYAFSTVSFTFAISTFFKKANTGAAAGGILFFITYFPYFFLQSRYEIMSQAEKMASCLLSNVGMAFGANVIGLYEGTGEGVHWWNFHRPATVDDNFSLLLVMVMLLVDTVICLLITWYVDAVFPGEFGVPQPWYFLVSTSYWCGSRSNVVESNEKDTQFPQHLEFFEREPIGLSKGISIKNLRKVFGSGDAMNVAVDGMDLNMYKGQITALLGHNGAGKTTTMSMLTGFLPPTSGTAIVNGFDIRQDIRSVRKTLGLCPQHDILFDSLTVREHLHLFAQLKGCPDKHLHEQVEHMIEVVGLSEKRDALSMTLSGGQKRKLSVGIALIADSQVVILDEPTSGMDPQARRQVWTILQQFKQDRTVLLTTHFMDEADILGDRIAIMAEGVVKCCGTSLFLKNKYGSGYHLIIVKTPQCDIGAITDLIKTYVPSAEFEDNIGAELSYILPNDDSPKFEGLFKEMESHRENLGISSFGASVTTMEEVFLRVGEGATDDPEMLKKLHKHDEDPLIKTAVNKGNLISNGVSPEVAAHRTMYNNKSFDTDSELMCGPSTENCIQMPPGGMLDFNLDLVKNTGMALHLQQFRAAFVKKALHTWRNRTVAIIQLSLPIIFTCLALVVDMTATLNETEPSIALDMSHFRENNVAYREGPASPRNAELGSLFLTTFLGTSATAAKVNTSQYNNLSTYFAETGRSVGVSNYNRHFLIGGSFDSVAASPNVTVTGYFNGQLYHSVAISLTTMLSTLMKYYLGPSSDIRIENYPLPENIEEDPTKTIAQYLSISFTISFCILFGMAFLASSFVMFIIREKSFQAKHIQIVCGLKKLTFWLANFSWDFINYLLPCLCLLIVFVGFGTDAYAGGERLGCVFLVLVLYGWSILPFVYMFHFPFTTAASGVVAMTILNIFTGLATLLAVFVMSIPSIGLVEVADALGWVFSILLPNYCLGQGFMSIYLNYQYLTMCEKRNYKVTCQTLPSTPCCDGCQGPNCFTFSENYLAWDSPGIGRYVTFMGLQGFLYFAIVLMIEYGFIRTIWYKISPPPEFSTSIAALTEDDDVSQERERINALGMNKVSQSESLVLGNVTKSYGGYIAVDRLCLGVPQNECFGLLGVNGAGKTSTFKMLTGDENISDGNAFLNGHDVKSQLNQVQANLGYCPQFDALIEQLTGRETLTMFARLKGIPEYRIGGVVRQLMKVLTLEEHADKETRKYSGGNKRKLSTAISLIGDPPVIFLDEPTTGVDPAARRQLWNVLSDIRASGRTLILTSHSMEECDALCTRIAIMVNGRFLCLGSPQHLKNKFGQGYTLIARIGETDDGGQRQHDFVHFIETTFPKHEKVDASNGYFNYHLTDPDISLSFIFGTLEKHKDRFNIEDYSVSQTTLQQVFIDFARKQVPPRENNNKGICKKLCCCCATCE